MSERSSERWSQVLDCLDCLDCIDCIDCLDCLDCLDCSSERWSQVRTAVGDLSDLSAV